MNRTQENLKRALMLAGVPEEKASERIKGFSGVEIQSSIPSTCPRCRSKMVDVQLIGSRKARYCPVDRVVVPYPVTEDSTVCYDNYMKSVLQKSNDTDSIFASTFERDYNY